MAVPDASQLRQMRLLLKDRGEAPLFSDEDLADCFLMEGGVKRSCALALESIAQDEARALKCIKTMGLETNGKATAESVLLVAGAWREQDRLDNSTGFVIVPLVPAKRHGRGGFYDR